jgi:uncharacterized protein (DUF362 family)
MRSLEHPCRRVFHGFVGRWFLANSLLSGVTALVWLLLRSGSKPSRLAYPCQRAAAGTAGLALGAPLVAVAIAAWRRVNPWMRAPAVVATAVLGLVLTASLFIYFSQAAEYSGPVLAPPLEYRAQLYHVTGCPQDPAGDHFVGLSNLVGVMGRGGLKFYESAAASPVAGPDGVVASNDVVVIKINYQWDQRGGTNTDLLRGLIRTVVDHPDDFTGEVVVCENAQFNSVSGFDRALNNAQDHALSPHDVVAAFQAQGFNVSHFDWTARRSFQVNEYSAGDLNDGYVVGAYDSRWQGKLSYPKFRSSAGTYISLRYGIWNPDNGTYNRTHLKFINVPVLKSHHATYGATVSTKHYMGVVTDQFSTNSHGAIRYGIMGALMGEIQMADVNIVDAIWINANPYSGPGTTYAGATRRDELVASLDPIALDRWSVKNILIPGFVANGYSPPWPSPSADPDLASGAFRTYLDNSMNQLLAAGYQVTNDYSQIDVLDGSGAAGDFDGDGAVGVADYSSFDACYTGPGGGPVGPECAAGDFDGDGDIDCDDWQLFKFVWTSSEAIPPLAVCDLTGVPGLGAAGPGTSLSRAFPNPMGSATGASTKITYTIAVAGPVRLTVFDASGRVVRTLVDRSESVGVHTVSWDGRSDRAERVGRGVYSCRLLAPGFRGSGKIVIR